MPLDVTGYTSWTPALRALVDPAAAREAYLAQHLPYLCFASDDAMMLRTGELMATLRLRGLDPTTTSDRRLEALRGSLAAIVAQTGSAFGYVVHRLPVAQDLALRPVDGAGFAAEVDRRWRAHVDALPLQRRELYLTVLRRPPLGGRVPWLSRLGARAFGEDREARLDELDQVMGFLAASLAPAHPKRLTRRGGDWLGCLGALLTGRMAPIGVPDEPSPVPLAARLARSRATFEDDTVRLTCGVTGEERFGAVFGLKTYPSHTDPSVLDALDLPGDVVLTNSFTPIPRNLMAERIGRTIRQMAAADDAAISLREALVEAADLHEAGGLCFGDHHASLAIYCESREALRHAASLIRGAGQEMGAVIVRERLALRATWFAQMPGNWHCRARRVPVSSDNFADLAAFHGSSEGRPGSRSPWGEPITVLPGLRGTGYRFHFHEPGRPGAEPTVGHTLVLGRTGAGKSVTVAFLVAQARRAGARIVAFDKDRGLEMAIRALGGRYETVRAGAPTGFGPLATETDARGRAWLTDWLAELASRHAPLSGEQSRFLTRAVDRNAAADPELRSFEQFVTMFGALDDDGDLQGRLREWAPGGRYGWVFGQGGGAGLDATALATGWRGPGRRRVASDEGAPDGDSTGAEVMGFDMTELLGLRAERTAVLSYLFRRIERMVESTDPTIILIDEAWQVLDDDYFAKRLENWLVTLRKANAVVVMLTQYPGQIMGSAAGRTILETVPTQVLFPNDRARPDSYEGMGLDDKEVALLTGPSTGRRAALVRSAGEGTLVDVDVSALGGLVAVLGGGETGERSMGSDWRDRPDFWRAGL